MEAAIERQAMKKVYLRLLPFCFVLYFICYLDRVNIGFAALTMNKDIGLSAYVFGLGAGAFFWGYSGPPARPRRHETGLPSQGSLS